MKLRTTIAASLLALAAAGTASAAKLTDESRASMRKLIDLLSLHPEIGETRFGELGPGEAVYVAFEGDRTVEYYVSVVCDDDCQNVDLAVLDVNGAEIDVDDADDNVPLLNIHADLHRSPIDPPAGIPRPMTLEIRMKDCKAETCGYALRISQVE